MNIINYINFEYIIIIIIVFKQVIFNIILIDYKYLILVIINKNI